MEFITKQQGKLFFERMEEAIQDKKISDRERILRYRTILEDLFKELTADANILMSNVFARISFISQEYNVPKQIQDYLHSLRQFANKIVHSSKVKPNQLENLRCVFELSTIIAHFSRLEIPLEIKGLYSPHIKTFAKYHKPVRPRLPYHDFFAVIEDINYPKDLDDRLCILMCNTEALGRIKLKLWNNKDAEGYGSDLSGFGRIATPFQTIYITKIIEDTNKEDEYKATESTLIILEPDYLLDTTDLADCRQLKGDNPLLFLLNRFTKGEITDRMMVGNIVGKMLDDISTNAKYEFRKSFESVMRSNAFGMLCMANEKGTYDRATIQRVYIEAQDQEKTLTEVLSGFKGQQLIIEPTFISNKYGLQGRLDLLVDYKNSGNQKDIIELKSSKNVPSLKYILYPNHEAQTMCYDLLLSSTYPDRIGHNSILYSSASLEEKPLRHVNAKKYLSIQALLMLRNIVVANELKLAEGDFQPFFDILSDDFGPVPPYLINSLSDFVRTIKGLPPLLRQYFLGYLQFIHKELQVAKIGDNDTNRSNNGFADLWKSSKAEKIENYNVLVYLKVKEITDDFHLTLEMNKDLFSANVSTFRKGEIAILYPTQDPEVLNPLNSQILKCTILSVEDTQVRISLINKQVSKDYFKGKKFWALDRDFREAPYKRMLQLNYEFLKTAEQKRDLILGLEKPKFGSPVEIPKGSLNNIQHQLVQQALAAEDYFLIQGPPGTGKTSKVLCEIVKQVSTSGENVMVIAFTNRAVNEISEKLAQIGIGCIRLGKGDQPYHWSQLSAKLKLDELHEKVNKTQVFLATQSMFTASMDLLKFKEFDTLIIDEASQLIEPQLVGIFKHFNRWILIGDENQLPAVVLQKEEDSKCHIRELQEIGLNNYRESLFSRLKQNAIEKGWNDCYGTLTIHYRMHEEIAKFPNKEFYKGVLEIGCEDQKAPIPGHLISDDHLLAPLFSKSRVVFIPTKRDLKSKINDEEADLVNRILSFLKHKYKENFDPAKTVGVITPFRAQIANIKSQLADEFKDVTVDTVERYQGSERDIIIISFAVKSVAQLKVIQSINQYAVDRKLNVALTRAKQHLILLGTEKILKKNFIFKNLIKSIKENGGYMMNPMKVKSIPTDLF